MGIRRKTPSRTASSTTTSPAPADTASADPRLEEALRAVSAPLGNDEIRVLVVSSGGAVTRSAHITGTAPRLRDLEMAATDAVLVVRDNVQLGIDLPFAQLTAPEEAALREGGFERAPADHMGAADLGTLEYRKLLREALTPQTAARRLGVNESRIRQRLGKRELLGIKDGRGWKLPRFQFESGRLVPGIERVLPRLAPTLHPVAVQRWFATPHPDLQAPEDATARTPLDWLGRGSDPSQVAALAAEL